METNNKYGSSGYFETNLSSETLSVRIAGNFGLGLSGDVRDIMRRSKESGVPNMILDLRSVDYIDSSGIGTLVFAWKQSLNSGGDLRILGIPEQAKKILSFPPFTRDGILNPEVFQD